MVSRLDIQRFQIRVDRYDRQRSNIRVGLYALITRYFKAVKNPGDPVQVEAYSRRVSDAVRRAQMADFNLAVAQQKLLLLDQGVDLTRFPAELPLEPRGVDPVVVAERAMRDYRVAQAREKVAAAERAIAGTKTDEVDRARQRVADADRVVTGVKTDRVDEARRKVAAARQAEADAKNRRDTARTTTPERDVEVGGLTPIQRKIEETTLELALLRAGDDLDLAMREGSRQTLVRAGKVITGFRRVIHPELSATGTCGLCVAASSRTYHVEELLPIHGRCKCTVSPIIKGNDPGHELNQQDLSKLYDLAGPDGAKSTAAADLKKVRYRIDQHGELGPYLRTRSKGGDDPAARIVMIDQTLAGLGEWADKRGDDVDLTAARDAQLDHRTEQSKRLPTQPETGSN